MGEIKKCSCGNEFEVGLGFIGVKLDTPRYPLAKADVIKLEVCLTCARVHAQTNGAPVHSTTAAIHLMKMWAEQNARRIAQMQERQDRQRESAKTKSLGFALSRPDDKGFVNQTIAEAKPFKVKAKRGRQRADAPFRAPKSSVKNYGGEVRSAVQPTKKSKNKKEKK
jgi:hypothetical protein